MKLTFWILGIIAASVLTALGGFAWAEDRYEHKADALKREQTAELREKAAEVREKTLANQIFAAELGSGIEILKLRKGTLDDRVFDLSAKIQVVGPAKMPQPELVSYERYKSERDAVQREIEVKQRTLNTLRGLR